ncbi:hypothetical protein Dip510_001649 [Elusimicrobium posterum]|uniref:hypothetical protein n=1 Tax=Elusimicrobium posterum TaxID=3116653 RepID=UPI003C721D7F
MECEKTILSGAFDVRVAPYNKATPATLADAISIGLTNGGVELTSANEKTAIEVDQLLGSPRFITTKAALGGTINMAEITLENIAKAFDTASQPTVDGDKTVLRIDPNSENITPFSWFPKAPMTKPPKKPFTGFTTSLRFPLKAPAR